MCGGGDHDATTFAVGFNGRALLHCCTRLHCMDGRYVDRGVVQRWMSLHGLSQFKAPPSSLSSNL